MSSYLPTFFLAQDSNSIHLTPFINFYIFTTLFIKTCILGCLKKKKSLTHSLIFLLQNCPCLGKKSTLNCGDH